MSLVRIMWREVQLQRIREKEIRPFKQSDGHSFTTEVSPWSVSSLIYMATRIDIA